MKRYKNVSGDSGVVAYEIGADFIKVKFVDGGTYLYTNDSAGRGNVESMKKLAVSGRGLSTFIVRNVRMAYETKRQ